MKNTDIREARQKLLKKIITIQMQKTTGWILYFCTARVEDRRGWMGGRREDVFGLLLAIGNKLHSSSLC